MLGLGSSCIAVSTVGGLAVGGLVCLGAPLIGLLSCAPVAAPLAAIAPAISEAVAPPPPAPPTPEISRGAVIGLAVAGMAGIVTGLYYWTIKR
jgi:hypothetical protein